MAAAAQDAPRSDLRAVVLYDLGGKFDKSFNEAAYNGAMRFQEETGIRFRDFEPTSETQYEQALKRFARRKFDVIVAVGVGYAVAARNVARDYPESQFTVIDAVVDLPNVRSVTFKEHEGSFLVGVLAAMATETNKVGFIGGMDIPLIQRFAGGYRQGVDWTKDNVDYVEGYVGTTPSAWSDPIRAAELAKGQYGRGVDVIFHAAGPSGLGVLQAAKDEGKLAIGVDSNQNFVAPGHVLTSMVKRVDRAVYEAMEDTRHGRWEPGHEVLGLAEKGVGYVVDEHNRALITDAMEARVEEAREKIIAGDIVVKDVEGGNTGH
ncbi:BMP family lipoprotein [Yunchengibacter salinarum]